MSVIVQQPDSLSFSQNLRKFVISSSEVVSLKLKKGEEQILDEFYQPGANNLIEVDIHTIVDSVLSISLQCTGLVTEQIAGIADFTAMIDGTPIAFRVIKGGVSDLQEMAASFTNNHFLSWQIQDKRILQHQPEWLTVYNNAPRNLKAKAYYLDNSEASILLASLDQGKLLAVDVSWASINSLVEKKNPIAWDVWFEDDNGTRLSYVQRYCLRNPKEGEKIFIWANTLGGIDTISLTGSDEDDKKLEHLIAETGDESLLEYQTSKNREVKQSTGYLTSEESRWIEDFFYSQRRYLLENEGSVKQIVVVGSKIVSSNADDLFDYEFTYRFATESQLLNLDRSFDPLPVLEVPADFFLTELLSGLTAALYADNLLMAVQSPFAQGWQKLSFAQLWNAAFPALVDEKTITFINGKLKAIASGKIDAATLEELKKYIEEISGNGIPDTRTILLSGAIMWESGLTYRSTRLVYKIAGEDYQISPQIVTLDHADPLLPRIDVFYVDSSSEIGVLKGVPGVTPAKPNVGFYELEITQAYIPVGAAQPDLDIENVYDENAEWNCTEKHDNNITVDFEAVTAPVTGSKHIEVAIDIPSALPANPTHFIGEKYQGGIIFYLARGGRSGYIATETPASPGVRYGESHSSGPNETAIGTGASNTDILMANAANATGAAFYAANYEKDGYKDWFLGSKMEMEQLVFRKSLFPDLTGAFWTSSEVSGSNDWKKAFCVLFDSGATLIRDKTNNYNVVPIRKFNDDLLPVNVPVEVYTPGGTVLTFDSPVPVDFTNGIVSLYLKSSAAWFPNTAMMLSLHNNEEKVGHLVISKSTGMHGFNPADPEWQLIGIQASMFSMLSQTVNKISISLINSWPNKILISIDRFRIQHDAHQIPSDLLKNGVYGSVSKHSVITVNPNGVITNIQEADVTPFDEQLTGTVNGENKTFGTSSPFEPGTITVFVNGIKERHFTVLSDTRIELEVAPKNIGFDDMIEATYIKKQLLI